MIDYQLRIRVQPQLIDLVDLHGEVVCTLQMRWTRRTAVREDARRIVACVNALRGISTESIERMRPEVWLPVIAAISAEVATEVSDALSAPERVIEYEVDGHPWASEEGCAPRVAGLDDVPVRTPRCVTHEQAAAERAAEAGAR